jgi:hypothetical protein
MPKVLPHTAQYGIFRDPRDNQFAIYWLSDHTASHGRWVLRNPLSPTYPNIPMALRQLTEMTIQLMADGCTHKEIRTYIGTQLPIGVDIYRPLKDDPQRYNAYHTRVINGVVEECYVCSVDEEAARIRITKHYSLLGSPI